MLNKRGITVQSVLIGMIILIIVAAILFFFYTSLPFKETINKDACRQSVILRSQSLVGLQPGQVLGIPLNCKTEEIKITTANEEVIKREIANAMYDCWWMLGEGRMQFWSESGWKEMGLAGVKSSCVICSTIRFDETVKRKNLQLDMASYLERTKIPKKNITYLEYFTEEIGTKLPTDVEVPPITTDKDYVILFMGIEGDEWWEPLVKNLGLVGGALGFSSLSIGPRATFGAVKGIGKAIFTPTAQIPIGTKAGFGSAKTATVFAKIPVVAVGLAIVASALMGTQVVTTLNNQNIVAARCDGERKGCMQVMLLPMDAANIAGVCNNIESIP